MIQQKNIKDMPYTDLKPLNLQKIQWMYFPRSEYFQEEYEKRQIVLHHTISGPGVRNDLLTWKLKDSRIGTCVIIGRDGTPYQLFSSRFWAWHLGVGTSHLDRSSIAIELDNWGPLLYTKNGYRSPYYGNYISEPLHVMHYKDGYRGYKYYEAYTEAQIRTLGELLLFWNKRYGITLKYHKEMWSMNDRALRGDPGVWTHVSYRPAEEKQDCHPDARLVTMLQNIELLSIV